MRLIFPLKLLNHEQDFPETFLLDVWRMCSLQRKMRVDAAALAMVVSLKHALAEMQLAQTESGQSALRLVVHLFLSLDYGIRVSVLNGIVAWCIF